MDPATVANSFGLRFRDPAVLRMSLVHSSYVNEHPQDAAASNERLEYLGDAFLGVVVARRLYLDHPEMDEGALTSARAAIVRGASLAGAAQRLGLGDHLLLGQGEESSGGRGKPSNLAAALEALIGAVYLDQGHQAAEAFALRALREELDSLGTTGVLQDPKSALQEALQARGQGIPRYRLLAESGPGHARSFTVEVLVQDAPVATGEGPRKVEAERAAARAALELLAAGAIGGSDAGSDGDGEAGGGDAGGGDAGGDGGESGGDESGDDGDAEAEPSHRP